MRRHAIAALVLLAWSAACNLTIAGSLSDDPGEHWFYTVRSKPADAAREAEYNAWYDDIDIPDVLAVPGFMRARRAVAEPLPELPGFGLSVPDAFYIALYDIKTADIDKSIIDLYVAARKMGALGRLTDVLKVVEANYYRHIEGWQACSTETTADEVRYLLIQKIRCCHSAAERDRFLEWYRDIYTQAIGEIAGLQRLDLYDLYRIMEVLAIPSEEIPHLLFMHEFVGVPATQAARRLGEAITQLQVAGRLPDGYVPGQAVLYRQMSDVRSN